MPNASELERIAETLTDTVTCQICNHKQDIPRRERYGQWECEGCGQQYEWNEGHCIQLTEPQRKLLRVYNAKDSRV